MQQLIKPTQLDPLHDIYGNELTVGCKVRSFDFAEEIDGTLYGIEVEGARVSYLEGTLLSYGHDGERIIEGCARYSIQVDARYHMRGDELIREAAPTEHYMAFPPLNGTPKSTGSAAFGVIRIEQFTNEVPTVKMVTNATRAHEMRYDDASRRRILTVSFSREVEGTYDIRTGWDDGGIKTSEFLRQFGTNLALCSNLKGERRYNNITREEALAIKERWRARCTKHGLTNVKKWTDNI